MNKKHLHRKWPALIGAIVIILAAGISLFFYHNFFRQTHGQLVETVPSDAMYILQINDNETFVKTSTQLLPYLNEILSLDALPGFEFFMDKFPSRSTGIIISCHQNDDQKKLLFSTKISEVMFKELLKVLKIDGRNYLPFDNVKIYSYGTHYKKYNFTFHNNFFSVSEDIELLKKSIVQLKHPRNLLSNREFSELFKNIVSKNNKQNWLIINNRNYFEDLKVLLADSYKSYVAFLADASEWSAFHIRFNEREIFLSGYAPNGSSFFRRFENQETASGTPYHIIPFSAPLYIGIRTPDPQLFADQYALLSQQKENPAIESFRRLSPSASYYFYVEKDSAMLQYLALQLDSNLTNIFLNDTTQSNISENYGAYSIKKCNLNHFNEMLSIVHQNVLLNYCTEYEEYYIFSDTSTSLRYYLDEIEKDHSGKQPLYRFVKTNIPSYNNYEFSMIFSSTDKQKNHFFAEESSNSAFVRGLQVFSYTFSAPEKGFVPINVYFKLR